MIVTIIGSGASGMAAAISAAENPETQVILLERQTRVGRKLQATGNGRCNLSNLSAAPDHYHGEHPEFAAPAIKEFNPVQTMHWFAHMGLYMTTENSGKIYPYSDQANSVVDVLRFALERPNIQLLCDCEVKRIHCKDGGFVIESSLKSIECDRLIVACGGLAGSKLGGSMSGYQLLRSLGHHVTKLRPALVQIKTGWNGISGLKGIRTNCQITIEKDGEIFARNSGELQLTEQGISGPVVFEISRDVCQERGNWSAYLDFLPDLSQDELMNMLYCRKKTSLLCDDLLTGIIHNRLGRVLVHSSGIRGTCPVSELSDEAFREVCKSTKMFEISLTEPLGMDSAQVTAGGVYTSEFNADTMESRLVPGLFACGEVLDIDGDCGGYNLQWAWSSGRMAGLHAGGLT